MPLHTSDGSLEKHGGGLLSPVAYDDDAASLHSSRSEQDTDSDDDQLLARARNSGELRARDRMVLMEEEEMHRLIADSRAKQDRPRRGSGLAIPNPLRMLNSGGRRPSSSSAQTSSTENLHDEKRSNRRARRKDKRDRLLSEARNGEDSQLMYEMESGAMKEGSATGESSDRDDSDELDRQRLRLRSTAEAGHKRRRWTRWLFLHTLIAVGFAFLVLLAWKLSVAKKRAAHNYVSNGTALFAPTTLIISLDGFRADFLQRGLTPRLNAFVKEGVSPLYMNPSFPSVTFPNHYTIATGLYPESHGVVGNTFWDPQLEAEFYYTDPARSMDPKWWGGEPFWVTAESQGIRTAVHMWPGSEAHVMSTEPSFLDRYNGKEKLANKAARILEFFDKPGIEDPNADASDLRPQLVAAYVPNVDADGHRYGPNSTEIRATIRDVDTMLDQLFHGLEQRNLTNIVNVIVVSDHGMATTDVSRMVQIDDVVDMTKVAHLDGWPLVGIRPKVPADLDVLHQQALEKLRDNPNFEVYLKDKDMPERYHFSQNDRIAPLWIIPKAGWAIVAREEFDIKEAKSKGLTYDPRGLHGYDHEHPLMRAIFIARGPAFPHAPHSKIEPFQNIEVYNMLCDSVGMEPKPNNGTLRLPLKPIGLHGPETATEDPEDLVTASTVSSSSAPAGTQTPSGAGATGHVSATPSAAASPTTTHSPAAPTKSVGVDPVSQGQEKPSKSLGVDPVETGPPDRPHPNEGGEGNQRFKSLSELWDWMKGKADGIWDKLTGAGSG